MLEAKVTKNIFKIYTISLSILTLKSLSFVTKIKSTQNKADEQGA